MSKKKADVKIKESYKLGKWGGRGKLLKALGLSEKFARLTIAKNDTNAWELFGKGWKSLPSFVEIAGTFQAQVSAVGILHQNVVTEFARDLIRGTHDRYSPVK
jgi:hypothetical protein